MSECRDRLGTMERVQDQNRLEAVVRGDRRIEAVCEELARRLEEAEDLVWDWDAERQGLADEVGGLVMGRLGVAQEAAAALAGEIEQMLLGRLAAAREAKKAREAAPELAQDIVAAVRRRLGAAREAAEKMAAHRALAQRLPEAVRDLIAARLDSVEGEPWLACEPWAWALIRGAILPEEYGRRERYEVEALTRFWARLCEAVLPEEYLGAPGTGGRPAAPAALPASPSPHMPCTFGRVLEMTARESRGEALTHPLDAEPDETQALAPVQAAGNGKKAASTVGGAPVDAELVSQTWDEDEDCLADDVTAEEGWWRMRPPTARPEQTGAPESAPSGQPAAGGGQPASQPSQPVHPAGEAPANSLSRARQPFYPAPPPAGRPPRTASMFGGEGE